MTQSQSNLLKSIAKNVMISGLTILVMEFKHRKKDEWDSGILFDEQIKYGLLMNKLDFANEQLGQAYKTIALMQIQNHEGE